MTAALSVIWWNLIGVLSQETSFKAAASSLLPSPLHLSSLAPPPPPSLRVQWTDWAIAATLSASLLWLGWWQRLMRFSLDGSGSFLMRTRYLRRGSPGPETGDGTPWRQSNPAGGAVVPAATTPTCGDLCSGSWCVGGLLYAVFEKSAQFIKLLLMISTELAAHSLLQSYKADPINILNIQVINISSFFFIYINCYAGNWNYL